MKQAATYEEIKPRLIEIGEAMQVLRDEQEHLYLSQCPYEPGDVLALKGRETRSPKASDKTVVVYKVTRGAFYPWEIHCRVFEDGKFTGTLEGWKISNDPNEEWRAWYSCEFLRNDPEALAWAEAGYTAPNDSLMPYPKQALSPTNQP